MQRRRITVATVCLCFICVIAARPAARPAARSAARPAARPTARLCSPDTLLKVQFLLNQTADLGALDCRLYTPTFQHFQQICPRSTMTCFANEVKVLIEEWENFPPAISRLNVTLNILAQRLQPPQPKAQCPRCEVHQEQGATKFLNNLRHMIQHINSENCPAEGPQRLHHSSSSSSSSS